MNLLFKRTRNLLLNYFAFCISSLFKTSVNIGFPACLTIEPTNFCNLKCVECPSGSDVMTRKRGYMNINLFKKIIDEVYEKTFYLTLHFQGEPYLHPDFFEMLKYASDKKVYVAISTNGHFLSPENSEKTINSGLKKIIISIDGTTQDTYSAYRSGGSLENVIEGIKNIVSAKKQCKKRKPKIILQFIVLKSNQHQIDEMKELAKSLGVDKLEFKTAQIYNFKNGNSLIPSVDKYSRYFKKDEKYFIKNKLKNKCLRIFKNPVVTWDGWVVPCCFDKNAEFKFGNLNEKTFKEIWNTSEYNAFRKRIIN